jgi:LysM repeat protein
MNKQIVLLFLCTPLMWGCTSALTALRGGNDHVFEEMKTEIADLRHALHGTEVELKLLEEKFESREMASPKGDVAALQRKIALLEKTIDKMNTELKSLTSYAGQTTSSLSHHRDQIQEIDRKISEVSKLRTTLSQMSKTYTEPPSENTYRVKSGDTLEKIARKYQTTAEALKKTNQLVSDKIFIGQELIINQ